MSHQHTTWYQLDNDLIGSQYSYLVPGALSTGPSIPAHCDVIVRHLESGFPGKMTNVLLYSC